jgi:hypothetical protein
MARKRVDQISQFYESPQVVPFHLKNAFIHQRYIFQESKANDFINCMELFHLFVINKMFTIHIKKDGSMKASGFK